MNFGIWSFIEIGRNLPEIRTGHNHYSGAIAPMGEEMLGMAELGR